MRSATHSTSHNYPLHGHMYLFVHKPSQLPGEHTAWLPFRRTELFNTHKLSLSYRVPTFTFGSRECTCGQSALPMSTTSEHNSAQLEIEPAFLACNSRMLPLSHDAPRILGWPLADDLSWWTGNLEDSEHCIPHQFIARLLEQNKI